MTQEEYKNELKQINDEFETRKSVLAKKYALTNNPYKVGDVLNDHIGTIKVEKILVALSSSFSLPSCVYEGVELKKDGTPNKRGAKRRVYQINIIQSA